MKRLLKWLKRLAIGFFSLILLVIIVRSATFDLMIHHGRYEDVVEREGAKVFISPEAVLFLLGTEMDYEETVLRSGFVFKNPNQTSACGCGESVELKQADLAAMAAAQQA